MADGTHRLIVDASGNLVDVDTLVVGVNTVERQRVVTADGTDAVGIARVLNRPPLANEYGLITRAMLASGALGAFGGQRVVEEIPQISLNFHYGLNTALTNATTANGGTVTSVAGTSLAVLQTSANVAGSAKLESRNAMRYLPGQGCIARFTAIFTTGVANSQQEIGIGDDSDGFFFGYQGGVFGVFRRRGGVDVFTPQANWNGDDRFNGTGPSGVTLDPLKLNVYQIQFQWLGGGAIKFFREVPTTGELVLCHTIMYANTAVVPSILNPTLPLHAKVVNSGNGTNLTLQTPSMGVYAEGPSNPALNLRGSTGNRKTGIGATETSIITLRNAATFGGVTNRARVLVDSLSLSQSGAADCTVRLVLNTALGGVPAYANWDAATSVMQFDVAGTTLVGGRELFRCVQDGTGSNPALDLLPLQLRLNPGDTLTVAAASASGTVAPQVGIGWQEEF